MKEVNWKLLTFGGLLLSLISDIIGDGIMVLGFLFGWIIGILTNIQWVEEKDSGEGK